MLIGPTGTSIDFSNGMASAARSICVHNVGAILDTSSGWGVYGRPSRVSDLEREMSKHLVVRFTNAVTSIDICVAHLQRPIGSDGVEKQRNQCRALPAGRCGTCGWAILIEMRTDCMPPRSIPAMLASRRGSQLGSRMYLEPPQADPHVKGLASP
jgi:hypothetical protein